MEELGSSRFEGMGNTVRRKRSQTFRRLKVDASPLRDESPSSSTPTSDNVSKLSSDENAGGRRKEFSLNQCALRDSISTADEYPQNRERENGRSSEGVLAPANWKSSSKMRNSSELLNGDNGDGVGLDNSVKKVKIKVGGVTRTIQAKSSSLCASGSKSSLESSRDSDAPRSRQKQSLQEDSDENTHLRGIPWKDFTIANTSSGKVDFPMGRMPEKNGAEPTRKSKRVPKKRVLIDEEEEDEEIKYLEKIKSAKIAVLNQHLEEESSTKKRRIISGDSLTSKLGKDGKKSLRSEKGSEDTDYEEELVSDGEPESKRMKNLNKDSVELTNETKKELALTTRQRARLSGKDASGSSAIEFPNGLPPAPRKQKEKLTEVEQQLKKAEAAQRRRLQVEKANRESEAEAIRKILGQDSSRKKREEKNKKRQEEMEQEKAAFALKHAANTIRWVMSPTGTVVTFPDEMGYPSIFSSNPCSYPLPREKCAGPSCNNPYKYRDSKSKLPLCSLQCYKAIHATEVTS